LSFSVSAARAVRVSGTVSDAEGRDADEAAVELSAPADGTVSGRPFGNFGLTQGGGRFGILNIAPGRYALTARIDREGRRGAEVAVVPVTVGAFDVELAVSTRPAAVLTGTIAAGQGSTLPRQFQATVGALPAGEMGRRTGATVAADGTFELTGFSGPLRIWVAQLPKGWAVSRIEINGAEVTDDTFELRAGITANMRVIVSNQLGVVRGAETVRNVPVPDAAVVVFPADARQRSAPSRFIRWGRTDPDGQYSVDGLPPGDYRAIALDDFVDDESLDADALGRLSIGSTEITVSQAAPARVDLALMER
jgi:hypothetical protein